VQHKPIDAPNRDRGPAEFPRGGGQTGALLRAFDWGKTSLGPISLWPQSLRTAVDVVLQSPVPLVMLWGPEGVMIYNDAYAVFAGGRHPGLLGSPVLEGWPEVAAFNANVMDKGLKGETLSFQDKHLVLYRNGHPEDVWMDLNYSPLLDESGKPAGVLAIVIETTRRVRAQNALQESEAHIRQLLDSATDYAIFALDLRRCVTSWNEGARRILGWTADEMRGRSGDQIFTPEDRAAGAPSDEAAKALRDGRAPDERWHLRKCGERFWASGEMTPLKDAAGTPIGFLKILRDRTEERRNEEALQASEAARREAHEALARQTAEERDRLHQLFNQAPSFMAVLRDPGHIFELANTAYLQLVGHRDIVGKAVREALPEVEGQGFFGLLDQVYQSGAPYVGRAVPVVLQRTPGGAPEERFLNFIYQPIAGPDGRTAGIFVDGSDVTDRVLSERRQAALIELGDQLRDLADPAEIAAATAQILARVLGGVRAGYATVDGTGETATVERDWTDGKVASVVGRHRIEDFGEPFGAALRRGEIVTVSDVLTDERTADSAASWTGLGIRSLINAPLVEQGKLSAFLLINDSVVRTWSEDELAFVRDVADRAWAAAARARAVAAYADENRALETLNRVGSALAAELDLDRIVQMVTDAGVQLTEAQFGAFFYNVVNEAGESYTLYSLAGVPREAFSSFPMPRNTHVFGPTFRGDGIVRSDDITKDPRYGHMAPHFGMPEGHLPVRSYLAVPVRSRSGEVIGGLFFGHANPGVFTARSEQLMEGVAGQAATAVDNARLFQAAQREIEERRRAERALQALNANLEQQVEERTAQLRENEEALRQAQKMEAVGQLTGGIAHDFNNLLTGIVGSLDLMQTRITQGRTENLERYAKAAMSSANRAAALTHRLLAFARRQPLDPKPVNVNQLISSMEDLLRRTIGESVEMELVTAGGLWTTRCDPNQLESAILNLAINARDAMPNGGKLTIETANSHLDSAYAAAQRDVDPGQYVAICVTDTGTGMTADIIGRAFDPFFTTKPIGQGTGLGLSMVYGFAKQSEGHVRIYSEVGNGTTVRIYLPRYRGGREDDEEPGTGLQPAPRADPGQTVLVVEDEPVVRNLIVEVLQDLGYRALEAADGPAGLKLLQGNARIDLLVSDVGLPGLNGRQLADQARETRPELKVLFITGYAENAAIASGFLEPGMEMITKPFAVEALAMRIRQMIEA
jgi:PAS domain S-box-containing protein